LIKYDAFPKYLATSFVAESPMFLISSDKCNSPESPFSSFQKYGTISIIARSKPI